MTPLEIDQAKRSLVGQRVLLWGGIAGFLLVFAGLAVADFIPPPAPSHSAEQIARIFANHPTKIRAGLMLSCTGGALVFLFFALMSTQMRRIEG